ncbi:FG-GAP-like repeat-containing protein [Streptomyces coffeae]|uniref:VCBS repeat-containing protein n=1 Tax=Streptomyces coffeae TaxID=621382 RepID=A0ABS1N4Z4_9ACTN|nr:FG-GAP-like repeat-containing protein [Streptomyces coffeae]MBL1095118.1 VCBS repeat-containing protein [Streptomyces coffeae]
MAARHKPGHRRTLIRGGIAATVALGLAAGGASLLLSQAQAEPTPLVIPAPDRYAPTGNPVYGAGTTGVLERRESATAAALGDYQWTTYGGSATFAGSASDTVTATASDIVSASFTDRVTLKDMKAGTSTTLTLPAGQIFKGSFGDAVLTATRDAGGEINGLHILRKTADGLSDTTVTGLNGWVERYDTVLGGDTRSVAIWYAAPDGTRGVGLLDLESASVRPILPGATGGAGARVAFSGTRLAWYSPEGGNTTVRVLGRDALDGPETKVTLPAGGEGTARIGLVGDSLLTTWDVPEKDGDPLQRRGEPLKAVPLAGGETRTLLPHAQAEMAQVPGGGVIVTGGDSARDWAVRKVTAADDGSLTVTKLRDVAVKRAAVDEVSLTAGQLVTTERDSNYLASLYQRDITLGETPKAGDRSLLAQPDPQATGDAQKEFYAAYVTGTGDGRYALTAKGDDGRYALEVVAPGGKKTVVQPADPATGERLPADVRTWVTSASGRYVVFGDRQRQDSDVQYVVDLEATGGAKVIRAYKGRGGLAVWGTKLWRAGETAGTLTSLDLKSGATETVQTGNDCVPVDVQAVGRWVSWDCGLNISDDHGVYDRVAKEQVGGYHEGTLGDGYILTHDTDNERLLVTPIGGATKTLAQTPEWAGGKYLDADRFGTGIAFLADNRKDLQIFDPGVPTSPLTKIESRVGTSVNLKSATAPTWQAVWQLSKPATGAKVTIKDRAGKVVRTLDAALSGAALKSSWDGRTDAGRWAVDGTYTWQLSAAPEDGSGADLSLTGTFSLTGGTRGFHDLNGGSGDLMTLSSSGYLTTHYGNGTGAFGTKASGSGWPAGTVAVPFGDLGEDRCNDVLVRMPGGELRRYTGKCAGGGYTPSSSHTVLGTGWDQYNVLTAPGDLTGDGRTDLIARQSSTGDIYLYADNGAGGFKARTKIRTAWTAYTHLIGAGDLNGDGYGDLLARHTDGTLYRYDGTADGQFKSRVVVFTNWGSSYNAVVGVGDITGDGKADLVARDTGGNVYRNSGDGKGSFSARTRITTGWQGYKGLF